MKDAVFFNEKKSKQEKERKEDIAHMKILFLPY